MRPGRPLGICPAGDAYNATRQFGHSRLSRWPRIEPPATGEIDELEADCGVGGAGCGARRGAVVAGAGAGALSGIVSAVHTLRRRRRRRDGRHRAVPRDCRGAALLLRATAGLLLPAAGAGLLRLLRTRILWARVLRAGLLLDARAQRGRPRSAGVATLARRGKPL